MPGIDQYAAGSGRRIKEDGSIVNLANKIEEIHKALVTDKNAGVQLSGSNVIQPVDIQSRYSQTIQTHNAVSVATNGWSESAWLDTNGFDKLAVSILNDAMTNFSIQIIWSHDGSTKHSIEVPTLSTGDSSKRNAIVETKARYAKVSLNNADVAAHIMSAWAYLKA